MPQLRGMPGWQSDVHTALSGKCEELTRLAPNARGLSSDIDAAFTDTSDHAVIERGELEPKSLLSSPRNPRSPQH